MSNTSTAAAPVADETRTAKFVINSQLANEVLAVFGVPVPDAADLDEIVIVVRDTELSI